jgi:hypothetical protein
MTYAVDLTPAEIAALTLKAGTFEIAPDTYLNISENGFWSVANEDGEIDTVGLDRDGAKAYLLGLVAEYEIDAALTARGV